MLQKLQIQSNTILLTQTHTSNTRTLHYSQGPELSAYVNSYTTGKRTECKAAGNGRESGLSILSSCE